MNHSALIKRICRFDSGPCSNVGQPKVSLSPMKILARLSVAVSLLVVCCALPVSAAVHIEHLLENFDPIPAATTNSYPAIGGSTTIAPVGTITPSQAVSAIPPSVQVRVINTNLAVNTNLITFTLSAGVGKVDFATASSNQFIFSVTNVPNSTNIFQVALPSAQYQNKDSLRVLAVANPDPTNAPKVSIILGESN